MDERRARHDVDVVVIGGGPPGENAADRARKGGLSVTLVEGNLVGGECSYYACIPSKALLRPGAAVAAARSVDGARQAVTGAVSADGALARRTYQTNGWVDDTQAAWLASAGIGLVRGHGRLAGERTVEVDGPDGTTTLHARHAVVVATGTQPLVPPVPGLAEARPWTNREATRADRVPRRLAVLGGGPVACELATAWRSLGSEEVTVVERGPRLLGRVEPFAAEAVAAGLAAQGIDVRTGASATRVDRPEPGGPVRVELDRGDAVDADEVLVATGRRPGSDDLGLETVGLEPGSWLAVDDTGRVVGGEAPTPWLYAVGDITHVALLTHMGKYQARACGDTIAARAQGKLDGEPAAWSPFTATAAHRAVPQVVYTRPEVAAVGLSEAEARDAGLDLRVVRVPIAVAGASLFADDYEGTAQLVVDDARRVIVGATFVGPEAGELLHAATIAVVGEVPLDRLWHAVPAFPSISELWLRLLERYGL